jgi:hypothetical protein
VIVTDSAVIPTACVSGGGGGGGGRTLFCVAVTECQVLPEGTFTTKFFIRLTFPFFPNSQGSQLLLLSSEFIKKKLVLLVSKLGAVLSHAQAPSLENVLLCL